MITEKKVYFLIKYKTENKKYEFLSSFFKYIGELKTALKILQKEDIIVSG